VNGEDTPFPFTIYDFSGLLTFAFCPYNRFAPLLGRSGK
jgi:hypothetical protein